MMRSLWAAAEEKCTFGFLLSYVLCLMYVLIGGDIRTEKKIQGMQMLIYQKKVQEMHRQFKSSLKH